jgi:hypothetical protein
LKKKNKKVVKAWAVTDKDGRYLFVEPFKHTLERKMQEGDSIFRVEIRPIRGVRGGRKR